MNEDKTALLEEIAEKRKTFTPTLHGVPTGTDASFEPRVYWLDGRPRWFHMCDGIGCDSGLPNTRWKLDEATDTISPSLHCTACGTHGFWTNGAWRNA